MLIKEYLNVVGDICFKNKDVFKTEFIFVKNTVNNYINDFDLKRYLKKNIFEENKFLNIFLLFFIFKMIYDFLMFFFYTLDLFATFFFK
jgi:hypothetical protein